MAEISATQADRIARTLNATIKMQIEIDGNEVYITDIKVENSGEIKVEFFALDRAKEAELSPHVHACIKKLIEAEHKCQVSNKRSSTLWSRIKNTLLK
ncbi:head vertex assembly chaperone [Vibrio phage EniLVp02]